MGVAHFIFRKQFFAITEKFENQETDDLGAFNLWNFLFYISIGLAIVLSVRVGGVIPVFTFIVVPPVAAILMTKTKSGVIVLAMALAVLGAVFGLYFSVQFDFPAGSSIVVILGVIFAVASVVRLVRR